ncbi:aa3-type cytochrome c oxidase subunit IV [Hoeflea sp. WL0058]|uniref:Aa3-type cytochrome c oxidase subunit IV n=1 Tax=Flavimaribacter sediminis TaxID=2865987 RepID=A0AAE2ZQI1_9HYPH|nr:aa3-type cytochrome c oxidase subunit IV [Flavimaribacter sediminis]MBW8638895.1 aa3-type cytochrome c oxidase subunit IV [Flavimaribacter sediminis]
MAQETANPDDDFETHEKTYYSVLHLVKWIMINLALILAALAFAFVLHSAFLGGSFLILALVALVYGVASIGRTARESVGLYEAHHHQLP